MKSWKTTVCGLAIAILMGMQNYNGKQTWQGYAQAAGVAALGFFAKDHSLDS